MLGEVANYYLLNSSPMGLFDRFLKTKTASPSVMQDDAADLLAEGISHEKNRMFDEAIRYYQLAIQQMPSLAQAHFHLGNILLDRGEAASALASYGKAVYYKPDSASASYNMGNAYTALGRIDEALAAYQKAAQLNPNFVDAQVAQGSTLEDLIQLEAAVECYRCALAIAPEYAEIHYNLGITLKGLGKLNQASDCFHRAVQLRPNYLEAHNCLLFIHNYLSDQSDMVMLDAARHFGQIVECHAVFTARWGNVVDPTRTLRVGFVSGDFRDHPVGYFLENVWTALTTNTPTVNLYAYLTCTCKDATSDRLKIHCTSWRAVEGLSDEQLAQRIRDDEIDILIDLAGHTANNRLAMFAWKPAPVQVSWLGYFATTGVAAIDYFIADPWTLPPSEESNFTEQVWRLPETRLCFTPPDTDVAVSDLPALSNGYVTFGCFNNLSKMNDSVVALWARILTGSPSSRLFLKAGQISVTSVRQSIRDRFAVHGIAPDRLILEEFVPRTQYLAAYQKVDIALDPFPYTGGTTTVEALWMGVPVLTLTGTRFLSRQGVGLLMNAGLPEWIASDPDDYVARALSLTSDLPRLAALRSGLRNQVLGSPVFDAPRFARHFEQALRDMWKKWCSQQSCSQSQI